MSYQNFGDVQHVIADRSFPVSMRREPAPSGADGIRTRILLFAVEITNQSSVEHLCNRFEPCAGNVRT